MDLKIKIDKLDGFRQVEFELGDLKVSLSDLIYGFGDTSKLTSELNRILGVTSARDEFGKPVSVLNPTISQVEYGRHITRMFDSIDYMCESIGSIQKHITDRFISIKSFVEDAEYQMQNEIGSIEIEL